MMSASAKFRQVGSTGRQIRDAQMARAAIPPLRRLSDLLNLVQEHRDLSARLLSGDAKAEPRRIAVKGDIESIQGRTRSPTEGWQRAATDWHLLMQAVESRAIGMAESDDWHAAVLRSYKACLHALEQLDGRLARRVDDLRRQQRRNLGGMSVSAELLCG